MIGDIGAGLSSSLRGMVTDGDGIYLTGANTFALRPFSFQVPLNPKPSRHKPNTFALRPFSFQVTLNPKASRHKPNTFALRPFNFQVTLNPKPKTLNPRGISLTFTVRIDTCFDYLNPEPSSRTVRLVSCRPSAKKEGLITHQSTFEYPQARAVARYSATSGMSNPKP
jgi:hypothetical protein